MEAGTKGGLSRADVLAAREGFWRLLRRKRINPRWIEANAEDLFAQAQTEYAEWVEEFGQEADSPDGWLVTTAWWRSQDLFKAESRRKPSVSIDEAAYLADESRPTPDQVAIDHEQRERLREAMGFLDPKDRQLLSLTYFDGLSIREAGRTLGWGKSTVDRHHRAALEKMRSVLEGRVELPAAEVGLAAWIAVEVEMRTAGTLAALAELGREGLLGAAHRAAELWRRLSPAAEPANASVAGAGVRTVGVCAAATVACIATGIVAPVDAVEILTPDRATPHAPPPRAARTLLAPLPRVDPPAEMERRKSTEAEAPRRMLTPSRGRELAPTEEKAGRGIRGPTQRERTQTNSEFAVEGKEYEPEGITHPVEANDPIGASQQPSGVAARPATRPAPSSPGPVESPPPAKPTPDPGATNEFGL